MVEEHRCEAPEGHILCANNCGFFGSPATMNLCSKCCSIIHLKEQEQASTKYTIETALPPSSSISSLSSSTSSPSPIAVESSIVVHSIGPPIAVESPMQEITTSSVPVVAPFGPVQPNRCAMCRKRIGLTGFKCKCGVTFCGSHRYPEKHACCFDFKTVGREEIAKANPLIKVEKLHRI